MMIYLMNSAAMPSGNYGTYLYMHAMLSDLDDVVNSRRGEWMSYIGYP